MRGTIAGVARTVRRVRRPVPVALPAGHEDGGPRTEVRAGGPFSVVLSAVWFGLAAGLVEVGILIVWQRLAATAVLGVLQMNRHFSWMIPVAQLAIFLVLALPTALLAAVRPGLARRMANVLFMAVGFFSLLLMIPGLYATAAGLLGTGLGYQAARWVGVGEERFRRFQRVSLPVLIGAGVILGATAFDRLVLEEKRALAGLHAAAPGSPNVLLIVLDTVRADHLSVYGYSRDTTPNLARLARRGVVFNEVRSAAPWTLPSHASLFTGRWPHELSVGPEQPLDATYPTLAEHLAKHGYATAGFIGNTYYCNTWYGLARGFVHYEDYYAENVVISPNEALRCTALGRWLIRLAGTASHVRPESTNTPKNAERINHDLLAWLATDRQERPFFAFLNYIDAHDPYLTPPGFDRHFGLKPESPADIELIRTWHQSHHPKDTPQRDATLVCDAYDDCLAALDEQLGHLFSALEERGVLNNTLVVLTSDHGEDLGEHGLYGHGKSLYRPELHVPLLVFGPAGIAPGQVVDTPVSLRDVAATIIERVGLAGDSPLPGRSLARCWLAPEPRGTAHPAAEPLLSEVAIVTKVARQHRHAPAMRGPMASVVDVEAGKVYIRDALGHEELYDLADRAETVDLAASPAGRTALQHCRTTLDGLVPRTTVRR